MAHLNRFEAVAAELPAAVADATFSLRIDLRVKDIVALWMEALHVGLGQQATKLTDVTRVIDVIGTQVQPSVADCIAMLVDPSRFPGCRVTRIDLAEDFDVPPQASRARPCLA